MKRPGPVAIVSWVVGLVGGTAVTIGQWDEIVDAWERLGWIPRVQYVADHVDEPKAQQILRAIDSLKVQQAHAQAETAKFKTAWRCDEWSEEIPVLRQERDALDPDGTTPRPAKWYELDHRLRDLEDHYEDLNCSAFVD